MLKDIGKFIFDFWVMAGWSILEFLLGILNTIFRGLSFMKGE